MNPTRNSALGRTLRSGPMRLKCLIGLGGALLALGAAGQLVADPDWTESEAGPPPSFNKERLIAIEMPRYLSSRVAIDPATLSVSTDGVVRYVVVISNASGSINALHEGIRCATEEVKTYARYAPSGRWTSIAEPAWQSMTGPLPSKHALALARQGLCDGHIVPAGSVPAIVERLTHPYPAQPR